MAGETVAFLRLSTTARRIYLSGHRTLSGPHLPGPCFRQLLTRVERDRKVLVEVTRWPGPYAVVLTSTRPTRIKFPPISWIESLMEDSNVFGEGGIFFAVEHSSIFMWLLIKSSRGCLLFDISWSLSKLCACVGYRLPIKFGRPIILIYLRLYYWTGFFVFFLLTLLVQLKMKIDQSIETMYNPNHIEVQECFLDVLVLSIFIKLHIVSELLNGLTMKRSLGKCM